MVWERTLSTPRPANGASITSTPTSPPAAASSTTTSGGTVAITATVVPGAAVVSTSATTSRHWSAVCTSTNTTVAALAHLGRRRGHGGAEPGHALDRCRDDVAHHDLDPLGQQLLGDRAPEDAEADHPHDRCLHGGHSVTSVGPGRRRRRTGRARPQVGQSKTQRVARVENSSARSMTANARVGVTSTMRWSRTNSAFSSGSSGPYLAM